MLAQIITPPAMPVEAGTAKKWEKCEQRLGLKLPQSFKTLLDQFGTGSFNQFLYLYNPFAEEQEQNLFDVLDLLHVVDAQARHAEPGWTMVWPFRLYPASAGLLPWGNAGSLDLIFFWQTGGLPETWPIIFYDLSTGEYETWKKSVPEFLSALFTSQIESVFFPPQFIRTEGKIQFFGGHQV